MTHEKEEEDMADIHSTNTGKLTSETSTHKVGLCVNTCVILFKESYKYLC